MHARQSRPTIAEEVRSTRVLVVEDAPKLLAVISERLRGEGYAVDGACMGEDAVRMGSSTAYDAIVLDLRLPDLDGVDVCRLLRAAGCWTPILMLTARDGVDDRVTGLDAGADDYLPKPFAFPELFARVRALVRRASAERPAAVVRGNLALDPATRAVRQGERQVTLTAKEFALLEYLMRHPNVVIGRGRLVAHVWDGNYHGDSNIVDVYMGRLRAKLYASAESGAIETVRGVGYRLVEDPPPASLA